MSEFTEADRALIAEWFEGNAFPYAPRDEVRRLLAERDRLAEELEHTEASHADEEAAHAETIARCDRLAEQCARLRGFANAIVNARTEAQLRQAVMQVRAALSEESK